MTLLGVDSGFKIGSPSASSAGPSQMNMALGKSFGRRARDIRILFVVMALPWLVLMLYHFRNTLSQE